MNLNKISVLANHVFLCRWRELCKEHVLGRRYLTFAKCKPVRFSQCSSELVVTMLPRQSLRTGVAVPVLPARTLSLTASMFKSKSQNTDNNRLEDEEDELDEAEIEELFQQQIPTSIGEEEHKVFIVHPDVKWGSRKQFLTTGTHIH